MPFEKGRPKTGGRQKGVENKKKLSLLNKAIELGVDPFEILLRFAAGDWKGLGYKTETIIRYSKDCSNEEFVILPAVRAKAAAEAAQYLYPKKKSVEFTENKKKKRPLQNITDEDLTMLAKKEFESSE